MSAFKEYYDFGDRFMPFVLLIFSREWLNILFFASVFPAFYDDWFSFTVCLLLDKPWILR